MSEYMTLLGAEDVRRAASQMQQAADTIRQAVGYQDDIFRQHRQFLEDWLTRFQVMLEDHAKARADKP